MRIEVTTTDEGLHGGREVWVRVLSNTIVDWPEVKRSLSPAQADEMAGVSAKPTGYYPGGTAREFDYKYEDIFFFETRTGL